MFLLIIKMNQKPQKVLPLLKILPTKKPLIYEGLDFVVPSAGLEPACPRRHWCLRPARLPIPPAGRYLNRTAKVIFIFYSFKKTFHYYFVF